MSVVQSSCLFLFPTRTYSFTNLFSLAVYLSVLVVYSVGTVASRGSLVWRSGWQFPRCDSASKLGVRLVWHKTSTFCIHCQKRSAPTQHTAPVPVCPVSRYLLRPPPRHPPASLAHPTDTCYPRVLRPSTPLIDPSYNFASRGIAHFSSCLAMGFSFATPHFVL